eukprot:scaffold2645_cov378-Prasinococcus_capsulatus_cf.AAC.2
MFPRLRRRSTAKGHVRGSQRRGSTSPAATAERSKARLLGTRRFRVAPAYRPPRRGRCRRGPTHGLR